MLSTPRSRHSGMFTIGIALLLLVTTFVTAPVGAESPNATFSVMSTQWGAWISGDGWEGEQVEVRVSDPDDVSIAGWIPVNLEPGNPMTFGFSLSGDAAALGVGWTVEVRDLVGTPTLRTLKVPLLTVDNVHTDDGTVHGSASDGLVFAVEACTDPLHICDVQESVSGVAWSTGFPEVLDRSIKAAYTDPDGDRYERYFTWPSLGYSRSQTAHGIDYHGLDLSRFQPREEVWITVNDPGETYSTSFPVAVNENGDAHFDLADGGIDSTDENGNPTVGLNWTFTARANGSDGEPIEKVLANTGLTLNAVDQIGGTASGDCSDGLVFFSVVRSAAISDDGEMQEIPCIAADGWSASWDVDELDVPFLVPGTQDGDGDGFGVMWHRASISVEDITAGNDPGLGFDVWSQEENATLEVWDADGTWVDLDNDIVPLKDPPDPLDPRVAFRLSDFINDAPSSVVGWTFRTFSTTQVKVLTIESIAIDVAPDGTVMVNEFGEVTGIAPANRSLDVHVGSRDGEDEVWTTQSNDDGFWAIGVDLSQAAEVAIWMADNDGDGISTWAPVTGAGSDTWFMASLTGDWVGVQGWTMDSSVTIEVVDESLPISIPIQDGNGWLSPETLGVDLAPGMTITVTGDGSDSFKTLDLVDGLSITLFDPDLNQVGGTAPAGAVVEVGVGNEFGGCNWEVQADSDGNWFTDGIPESCDPGFDLAADMGVSASVSDEDGDRTLVEFGQQDPGGGEPFLHVNAYGDEFIHGNNFDSDDLRVIEITNDPACTGRVYTADWEWQFDGAQFCEDGDLKPGHHVEVSYVLGDGVTPGELIRELTVHDVVITGADLTDDSVTGLATPGSPVLVGIAADPGEPFSFHAQRVVDPSVDGTWSVSFTEPPTGDPEANWGRLEIDDQEVKAFQFDEDGDFTTSDWLDFEPRMFVNVLADFAILQGWPTGPDITLNVFESEADGVILVHSETIPMPGPYYTAHIETDLEGIDLLSGHHVVATSGTLELSHTVTEIAITSFDFDNDSFTGTASDGATVAAGASNDTNEWEIDDLVGPDWTADFAGQVDFSEYNRIGGFVAEFDADENATFFMFEAEYEELAVAPGETSVTTEDGSVTIENLGEGDTMDIVTGPPPGSSGGFEYVGETLNIASTATGTPSDPLILTLRIRGEDIPPELDPEDIVVFKDGVEASNCVLPLDTEDDFPCVSERLRLEPSGDIELTVQTLSFSTWTMAFRSVTIDQFSATAEPVAVGAEVTATGVFLDVGKTQATGLTATVTWQEDDDCEVVQIAGDGIEAYHIYPEAGVFTPTLRLYAGSATDCAAAELLEPIDEAAYQYVVVYDPDGGFVTGGGWIYSTAKSYIPDPTLEGVATFGFVSKYKKGATVPTGNTEFQFHAGDLDFHSSSYDWLVVTGTPTAMFKGTGTINGIGEYKFIIWAGDGEPDTFRIKIWEEVAGVETVIYDNGSAQAIGGGSVIIHTAKK